MIRALTGSENDSPASRTRLYTPAYQAYPKHSASYGSCAQMPCSVPAFPWPARAIMPQRLPETQHPFVFLALANSRMMPFSDRRTQGKKGRLCSKCSVVVIAKELISRGLLISSDAESGACVLRRVGFRTNAKHCIAQWFSREEMHGSNVIHGPSYRVCSLPKKVWPSLQPQLSQNLKSSN